MFRCQTVCLLSLLVAALFQRVGSDEAGTASSSARVRVGTISHAKLTEAMRVCRGPYAVLLLSGAGEDERIVQSEFQQAADMFDGVACFSTLSCDIESVFCMNHNIRRTPAVLVYPQGPGAVQVLTGNLEKQEIAAGVARPIGEADKALIVNSENIDAFLGDTLRPLKLLLFSSRKSTPVILQALSSDPDLWPHVRFAFVMHTEKAVLQHFRVTEVPHIVLQKGTDSTTRESYASGELTMEGLRSWIKHRTQTAAEDPGEDGMFRAVEGATSLDDQEEVTLDDEEEDGESSNTKPASVVSDDSSPSTVPTSTVSPGPAPKPGRRKPGPSPPPKPGKPAASSSPQKKTSSSYKVMRRGAEGCPPGHEIDSVEECYKACNDLGIRAQPPWVSTFPGLPRFCSIRERPSSETGQERMHFNSSPSGQGRSDLSPICKVRSAAEVAPEAPTPTDDSDLIPELTGASKEALFGSEGFSLVYLREGRINPEEIRMLTELEQQFRQQLDNQGTKMRWMWMDLHVERKFKAHFDPPSLPSAVVLNPHKRPRFAMVKHNDDTDGDPLPADQSSIALLLNTVLGGDAQFSPLPAKALAKFAERSSE